MMSYLDYARQFQDSPVLPSRMDSATPVRIADYDTTDVLQPDAN
jgi:hypothetical protein